MQRDVLKKSECKIEQVDRSTRPEFDFYFADGDFDGTAFDFATIQHKFDFVTGRQA